ncbi:MAG: gamma-glutamylcyclotransferase [Patescibacteria group bacterium]|nr:gamma-glutamylcyclotransferase [Patescibacteria group bacterium]MDD4304534.1 gamma-glutamylcyclotransferase [Patescibacteria group bacterium]MDD4695642.1 gamma-glutamylcyclotransferase [Patescibacteria group bacterium]
MFEDLDKKNSVINDNIVDITKPIVSSGPENYTEKVDHLKETIFSNTPKPNKKQKFKKLKFFIFFVIIIILFGTIFFFFKDSIVEYFQIAKSNLIDKNINIEEDDNENVEDVVDEMESISTTTIDMEVATSTEQIFELDNALNIEALLDSDKDGLLDIYEDYYKTDKNNIDSDNDTYLDGSEVINGYNPNGSGKIDDNREIYYFAYGSNMNLDIMKSRCGEENFVAFNNSVLNNYVFYFYGRGYANIRESKEINNNVYGVLYKVNNSCMKNLDRSEGYPNLYQRREVKIKNDFGIFSAQVYIVENDDTKSNPSDSYYESIIIGAKQFSLPENHIEYIKSLK